MSLADHLRTLEVRLLDPDIRRDLVQLTSLLDPDFREFGCSGRVYTREEVLADLACETSLFSRTLTDFNLAASTSDLAVVTYRITRRHMSGQIASVTLRSSTWVMRDGRWQMLFHQGTPTSIPTQS